MQPSVGRIVHYTYPDNVFTGRYDDVPGQSQTVPAIIVSIVDSTPDQLVNLQVFTDGSHGVDWVTSIPWSDTQRPCYWNWPPRVQ